MSLYALQSTHDTKVVPLENRQLDRVEIFEVLAALILQRVFYVDFYILQRPVSTFKLCRRLRSVQQNVVDFLLYLQLRILPVAGFLRVARLDLAVAQIE